jgi:hypothetical protein
MMHPVTQLLEWFPQCDFAVLGHGFTEYGRDYQVFVETQYGKDPGRGILLFTHVTEAHVTTAVRDDVWPRSWDDVFTDYAAWQQAGEPDGYVWGSNWSLAYPGMEPVEPSEKAAGWAARLGCEMYEATITSDRFALGLVFHGIRWQKIDDRTDIVSKVMIPLSGP